ncbi:MAG TPA: DUF4139 domain-containing protein [Sulfurovum sp.]
MKLTTSFHALVLSGGLVYASSLAVYQDKTFYNFTPKDHFIGFTKNVEAKCEGRSIPLLVTTSCPSDERLCQLLDRWEQTEQELETVKANAQVLEKLISLPQPTTFDADTWIESAKRLGVEQARLSTLHKSLSEEAEIIEQEFQKQSGSKHALQTSQVCGKEIELTIPRGYISFSTHYEADMKDKNKATITQYLSVTNRSGIDIQADTAMFFYRSSQQYLHPIHFRPWIVSKYEPRPEPKMAMAKRKSMDMMAEREMMAPPVAMSAPIASYEDAREYKIKGLSLPSTAETLDVKVISWDTELACGIRAYPYQNTDAFHVCTFEPKYQIDSNNWKVKSSGELVNENGVGEYREGKYDLYTKIEEDIKIERQRIVNKERETGIFGGTVRKKDGFTLTLINKSDKAKDVTLIERIPTSTTEEITSKLLNINSEKKVNYTMLKDGQIEMRLTLAPHEHKKIDVLFEISHNKDMKVEY